MIVLATTSAFLIFGLRYITILTPEDPAVAAGEEEEDERVDLRTLRAIRVLRPLKLVSGVPSKSMETHKKCPLSFFLVLVLVLVLCV